MVIDNDLQIEQVGSLSTNRKSHYFYAPQEEIASHDLFVLDVLVWHEMYPIVEDLKQKVM